MSLDQFLQLTDHVVDLLRIESWHVENLKVIERLIEAPPEGEATVIGDLHGNLENLPLSVAFINAKRKWSVSSLFLMRIRVTCLVSTRTML